MRVRTWIKTVPSLAIIGAILFLVLSVGGGLLLWGSNFAHNSSETSQIVVRGLIAGFFRPIVRPP